eukprot:TRINITY_DN8037_c0_g1_i2.p1 TRINITY_DN8037_c0_g1~~TRINITY_DN8037_c0_g1_i2.p1  ORF type:complete len:1005 (+),score=185.60 TRINITY_DN8037_c0_g1_i2:213-3227(+)
MSRIRTLPAAAFGVVCAAWLLVDVVHYDKAGPLRVAAQATGLLFSAASGSVYILRRDVCMEITLSLICVWAILADAANAGTQEVWAVCAVSTGALAAVGKSGKLLAALCALCTVWIVLRTVDEFEDYGLLRDLEQESAAQGERDSVWRGVVALVVRLSTVCGSAAAVYAACRSDVPKAAPLDDAVGAVVSAAALCTQSEFDGASAALDAPSLNSFEEGRRLAEAFRDVLVYTKLRSEPHPSNKILPMSSSSDVGRSGLYLAEQGQQPARTQQGWAAARSPRDRRRESANTDSTETDSSAEHNSSPRGPDFVYAPNMVNRNSLDLPDSHVRSRAASILVAELSQGELQGDEGGAVGAFCRACLAAASGYETSPQLCGDSVVMSWNAHRPHPGHQSQVCACGLAVAAALGQIAELRRPSVQTEYQTGLARRQTWSIGAATGSVLFGHVGVLEAGVITTGTPVRQARRLAELGQMLGVVVLISDKVLEAARSSVYARPVDAVRLPGESLVAAVHELVALRTEDSEPPIECAAVFVEGFSALRGGSYEDCRSKLLRFLKGSQRDAQALRILRLSCVLEKEQIQERTYRGWEDLEKKKPELPDSLRVELQRVLSGGDDLGEGEFKFGDFMLGSEDTTSSTSSSRRGRKSLQHDKLLRAQIREAEAEANASQLAAWGLMPADAPEEKKEGEAGLPTKFDDQKGRCWFRGERCLGEGAFGKVYLGMGSDGGLVAVKTMRLPAPAPFAAPTSPSSPESASSGPSTPAARRRAARKRGAPPTPRQNPQADHLNQIEDLLREVALMQSLRHENVVAYFGSAVIRGHIMIVMEYLSGGSLDGVLKQFGGKLATTSIQRYVRDSTRGLAFLHQHKIVHRDMKPHNTLLVTDGQCKLADFGASAELGQLAKTGQGVIGTPLYMAPEACRGSAREASDVWGLGIMVCQLCSNVLPYTFSDDEPFNPHTFMFRLANVPDFRPEIPPMHPDAREFCKLCLKKDPEERPSAEALLRQKFLL